jgi:hypothetical protein
MATGQPAEQGWPPAYPRNLSTPATWAATRQGCWVTSSQPYLSVITPAVAAALSR